MPYARIPDHVLFRSFGSEMVLLNLETGQYHGLNETGARIVEVLAEVGDTNETGRRIAEEYGLPATEIVGEVDELCAALVARSLIRLDDGPHVDA